MLIDELSSLNYQLLHLNPKADNSTKIAELIEDGCDKNVLNEQGNAAVHLFSEKGPAENLQVLILKV